MNATASNFETPRRFLFFWHRRPKETDEQKTERFKRDVAEREAKWDRQVENAERYASRYQVTWLEGMESKAEEMSVSRYYIHDGAVTFYARRRYQWGVDEHVVFVAGLEGFSMRLTRAALGSRVVY